MTSALRKGALGIAALLPLFLCSPVHSQSWRLDRSTFDTSAEARSDFYQYVCGGWRRSVAIQPDRPEASWARDQAEERDREALTRLLADRDGGKNPELARLRTYFGSCMAQDSRAEHAGRATLQTWLSRIDSVNSHERLMSVV